MRNKLTSRTGASITFALLLFLVCAVISSVVIVAATTAAGRMSQMAEMDQRYYAVISAAELLKSEIDKKTVDVTASDISDESDGTTDTIIRDASKKLVKIQKGKEVKDTTIFSMDVSEISDNPVLKCKIVERLGNDGLLRFVITSGQKTPGDTNVYTLQIIFSSNTKVTTDVETGEEKTTIKWKLHSLDRRNRYETSMEEVP